ncbi:hypothetical protein, partial [Candidatus Magnetominusculus xianensis]|uniref:hypothetical protein n=1 Tax=Candidatus Magnetominusculus xianensis TaxID=1748249 RepID=UPI001F1B7E80
EPPCYCRYISTITWPNKKLNTLSHFFDADPFATGGLIETGLMLYSTVYADFMGKINMQEATYGKGSDDAGWF